MLRLLIALGIVAAIFIHSPERAPESLSSDLARLKEQAQAGVLAAASRSPLAQSIAESALRQTLSDTPSTLAPRATSARPCVTIPEGRLASGA